MEKNHSLSASASEGEGNKPHSKSMTNGPRNNSQINFFSSSQGLVLLNWE